MTPQCHVTIPIRVNIIFLDSFKLVEICNRKYSENGILSAFLRLCYLSVVTFQCLTYKFNTNLLEIELLFLILYNVIM